SMELQPISYEWKDENLRLGTGVNYGFSAQELNQIIPDVVVHGTTIIDEETGKLTGLYEDAYGVKYAELTPILVNAIKEQQQMIVELQKQRDALKTLLEQK